MRSWSLTSAEVQGTGHKKSETPCQDKTLCLERNKVRVIALADGAGSARLSHVGAEGAIRCVAEYLADHFEEVYAKYDEEIKKDIASELRNFLTATAIQAKCEVKDLSSTLLVVAVKKQKYIALHVGDGVIGCLFREELAVLSKPENGEFAYLTWFTTATDLEKALRVYRGDASRISGFILFSDGVEPSLYDSQNNMLADAVMNLFYINAKRDKREMTDMLLESLKDVIAKRTNDDCSIALLSRTRFKNYTEYAKYRKKVAKRNRKAKNVR